MSGLVTPARPFRAIVFAHPAGERLDLRFELVGKRPTMRETIAALTWCRDTITATGLLTSSASDQSIASMLHSPLYSGWPRPAMSFLPANGAKTLALATRIAIADILLDAFAEGPVRIYDWHLLDWVARQAVTPTQKRWRFGARGSEQLFLDFFTARFGRRDGTPTRLGNGLRDREGLIKLLDEHDLLLDRYTLRPQAPAR